MNFNLQSIISVSYKKYFFGFLKHSLFVILSIITLFPIYFIIVSSFKSKEEYTINKLFFPNYPTMQNFLQILSNNTFLKWFANSLILTLGSIILSLIFTFFAAYAFSKMKFCGRNLILNIIISLMVIPPILMVLPLFKLMANINMINNYVSVIFIYTGLLLPFSIYLLTNFFITIPNSFLESARIDGCSDARVLINIILPLSKAPIITLIVVNTVWVWSELLIALVFLQSEKMKTIMVGIAFFKSKYSVNIPVSMAAMLLATIPMLTLYIFGQRYFIRGITAGGIKG